MSDGTKIEWADATWNPITGCTVTSPGCTNCYAMKLAGTRLKHHPSRIGLTTMTKAGPVWTGDVRLNEGVLDQPLRWTRPRRIFVCAHGDLLHEAVPDEWLDAVWRVMELAERHQFLVLTKRAVRATRIMPLPNLWMGVSAEDQERADQRIPVLLATPAAVRWVSVEPLLGPVTLRFLQPTDPPVEIDALAGTHGVLRPHGGSNNHLNWVVVGGESGPNARLCKVEWVRSIVRECQADRVPVFVKQLGSNCDIPLTHPKGGDPSEWPEDLRVRQWLAP